MERWPLKISHVSSKCRVLTDLNELKEKNTSVLVFMGAGKIDQIALNYYEQVKA